jgi:Ala-tRNA(Pro) deacylase
MTVANRLANYLSVTQTDYQLLHHKPTNSAADSAHAAHLAEGSVVKSVLLRDRLSGHYLMALTPASNRLKPGWLESDDNADLEVVREEELFGMFPDCELGAVPGFGQAYDLDMIWDDQLADQAQLYFEAGNHEELIEIDHDDFLQLFGTYRHDAISLPERGS